MRLPHRLQEAIDKELESQKRVSLSTARDDLTSRYRGVKKGESFITKDSHRLAYLSARFPATFAAVSKVLFEITRRFPSFDCQSLLDLGSGPGTAIFAALEAFPRIKKITAFEKDKALTTIGSRLSDYSIDWQNIDLEKVEALPPHDLILFSYSVGELSEKGRDRIIQLASASAKMVVVIEPGTPAGFERIRKVRADLISLGNEMVAPCPHTLACPMPKDDWCHFAVRLERSSLHRQIKQASLNYEDEKFTYVAVTKQAIPMPESRILRHPQKRSGHINLSLCTKSNGLQERTVSKRTPELYKVAKDLEWGDIFTP
jgi:ribosomal protein RSM22 (predicted rRNA methylase)